MSFPFQMTIDVLKIDIESTEWDVLDNLIDTDMLQYIRHLLIEYHFFPTRPPKENYVHYFQVSVHVLCVLFCIQAIKIVVHLLTCLPVCLFGCLSVCLSSMLRRVQGRVG